MLHDNPQYIEDASRCWFRSEDTCCCPDKVWLSDASLWLRGKAPEHGFVDVPSSKTDENIVRYFWRDRGECPLHTSSSQSTCPLYEPLSNRDRNAAIRPAVPIVGPGPYQEISGCSTEITVAASPSTTVKVNGSPVALSGDVFRVAVPLSLGDNRFAIETTSASGHAES
jgi:hypothetical protein